MPTRRGHCSARCQLSEGTGLMRLGLTRRLPRTWLLALCACVVATAAVGSLTRTGAGAAVTRAGCNTRVNNTPGKLVPCIRTDDLWKHMQAFQAIADSNPGPDGHPSRNSGEPGYKASADYVAAVMRHAGYNVTIQTYKFFYFAFDGTPAMSELSPTSHT